MRPTLNEEVLESLFEKQSVTEASNDELNLNLEVTFSLKTQPKRFDPLREASFGAYAGRKAAKGVI